ncbi:MAG: thioredoxin family protein [Candidatus Saganbacteria bacterium]|nr:thioredoxin family protein [Candidatus Saganbacteria bacterium]
MEVKVFGKPGCEYCKTTMKKFETFFSRWNINKEKVALTFLDMETVDGLAEGAYNSVIKIPTTIIKKDKSILARWDGKVPLSEEFKGFFEDLSPQSEKDVH